jgi:hypothetical protein
MFTTKQTINFAGTQEADEFCMAQAAQAALPGTFVAWLSDATTDARDRIVGSDGWIRTDGEPFADSLDDLVAGNILNPPSLDQFGEPNVDEIATATRADGTAADETCSGGSSSYRRGLSTSTDETWTFADSVLCASPASFYCFEVGP